MPAIAPPTKIRNKPLKRAPKDRSQTLRRAFQLAFLALNIRIGVEFYLFVRYYETGGLSTWAARPPGVEGWLPIASLMNLKVLLMSGGVPALHPAGMFLLMAFLAASWIFPKSFCGWLCPVGTVSESLWRLGRRTFGRNFRLPRPADFALRSLKYIDVYKRQGVEFSLPGSHQELAAQLGTVRELVSRNLSRLQAEGLLKLEGRRVIVPNLKSLEAELEPVE